MEYYFKVTKHTKIRYDFIDVFELVEVNEHRILDIIDLSIWRLSYNHLMKTVTQSD